MAVLHGRAAGERVGTGGTFVGGFAGGFFLGLIGTGIAYAVASGSDAQLPALDAARLAQATADYQLAFRQGFEERVRSRRKGAALTGGLLGTATIVVLLLSATGN
jgi:flavin-dependent dehydrogenase